MDVKKTGLVLEGGGMRGAYTAGVLDYLMENDIKFPYVIGVSAGANNGANYVAGQRDRNQKVFVEMVKDDRYAGIKNLIKDGSYFGMDFIFKKLPEEIVPFDYETFVNSDTVFKAAVTNCNTAEPEYFKASDYDPRFFGQRILRASSSIPLIAKPVKIFDSYYYDGGIADPIPLKKAMEDGYEKNVIVLTKHKGFRLKQRRSSILLKLLIRDYPQLVEKLRERYKIYNNTMKLIEKMEKQNKVFVFRPQRDLNMNGLEINPEVLLKLYKRGRKETKAKFDKFLDWIE
ncbi:MAG: patatin family protein [Halanaerobiales bacterium]|nr:patatin family protein [Halanaerobiales bacterium]